jgi:hypothetical protein
MKIAFFLTLVLQIWAATNLFGETVLVPLPTIEGRYFLDQSISAECYDRYAYFEPDRIPLSVSRVWIHISGTFVVGQTSCFADMPPDMEFAEPVKYFASIGDTTNGSLFGATTMSPPASGPFEYTLPFSALFGDIISWDFLKAGYGSLHMNINWASYPDCRTLVWPEVTIEEAELVIEGEFPESDRGGTSERY